MIDHQIYRGDLEIFHHMMPCGYSIDHGYHDGTSEADTLEQPGSQWDGNADGSAMELHGIAWNPTHPNQRMCFNHVETSLAVISSGG